MDHPACPVNAKRYNGNTALIMAVMCRDSTMVKTLLNNPKVDVNLANSDSPLQVAIRYKRKSSIVRLILSRVEPYLSHQNDEGETALHTAVRWGTLELLELLLTNGKERNLNVNLRDSSGKTAVQLAAANGKDEAVKMLRLHGAQCSQ